MVRGAMRDLSESPPKPTIPEGGAGLELGTAGRLKISTFDLRYPED